MRKKVMRAAFVAVVCSLALPPVLAQPPGVVHNGTPAGGTGTR
jgi:hypothetical protein